MRMYLWETGREVPTIFSGGKTAFALWGDMLVGDIVCIERNPMSMFFRQERNLSASSSINIFCTRNGIGSDTDGGAGVSLHPNHHQDLAQWPNDPMDHAESGSLQLIAYGRGNGQYANAIRLQTRSGPGQITDRMVLKDGHVEVLGTLNATGGVSSSRTLKKDIQSISADDAFAFVSQLVTVTFKYISDPDAHNRVGFIAEDVPGVFAGAGRKGVDYVGVSAMLTKVVQQQQKRLKAQKQHIDILQIRLQKVEAALEMLNGQR